MNLEDLIVSTISDAKPMMILALCTIVLFVIVASLIEAWLAKARKAKSEADNPAFRSRGIPAVSRDARRRDGAGMGARRDRLPERQSERKTMREEKPDFEWGADRSEDDVMA